MNDESTAAAMLGRVVVLVHDHQQALSFYHRALGAEVIFDRTIGEQRLLHLSLPGQRGDELAPVGLWLLKATGDDSALVGRQSGSHPFLVLYTRDCAMALERFVAAGGVPRQPPRQEGGSTFAHVADLYGNEFVLVQL